MYHFIKNPETNRSVSIYTKKGQKILAKYITLMNMSVGTSQAIGGGPDICVYKNIMTKTASKSMVTRAIKTISGDDERLIKLNYSEDADAFSITYMKPSDDYGKEKKLGLIVPVRVLAMEKDVTPNTGNRSVAWVNRLQKITIEGSGSVERLILTKEKAKTENKKYGTTTTRLADWYHILQSVVAYNQSHWGKKYETGTTKKPTYDDVMSVIINAE